MLPKLAPLPLPFPANGITENSAFSLVPPGYTPNALNVRPFDTADGRLRGGQRPGTGLYLPAAVQADTPIQRLLQGDVPSVPVFVPPAGTFTEDFAAGASGTWPGVFTSWEDYDFSYSTSSLVARNNALDGLEFNNVNGSGIDLIDTQAGAGFGDVLMLRPDSSVTPGDPWTITATIAIDPSAMSGTAQQYQYFVGGASRNVAGSFEGIGAWFQVSIPTSGAGVFTVTPVAAQAGTVASLPLQATDGADDDLVNGGLARVYTLTISFDGAVTYTATWDGPTLGTPITSTYAASNFPGISADYTAATNTGLSFASRQAAVGGVGDTAHLANLTYENATVTDAGFTTRSTFLVAVAGGDVFRSDSPPSAMTASTGGTDALDASNLFLTAVAGPPSPSDTAPANTQRHIYFADGTSYKRLNLTTNTVSDWIAAAGALPVDGSANACRIGALYRNRLVLAGLPEDPQNWFMARSGDPRNWDYAPATTDALQAVAGNNTDAGLVADRITALIPYSDDTLIFGGDKTIWRMTGDPAEGGRLDAISYDIGVVGPDAFARDPFGNIYFMGTNGLNRLSPRGGVPELVSGGRLDKTFSAIDFVTTRVLLAWNRDRQGLHVFLSNHAQPAAAPVHYWYDQRTDSLWPERYPISNGPSAVAVFDGDAPDDRALILGGWDGFMRAASDDRLVDDDGPGDANIEGELDIGPFAPVGMGRRALLSKLRLALAEDAGDSLIEVHAAPTAQRAVESVAARYAAALTGGLNPWFVKRVSDVYFVFRLKNTSATSWAYESGEAQFQDTGRHQTGVG